MALGRAYAVAIRGLDGITVEIEADITGGLPGVHLVGLPDTALQESRNRVRAAITNCGNSWPDTRLTLALSPATLPKVGSMYDVALASAVLSAHLKKAWPRLEKTVLLGELALDGRVRPVNGVLPAVLAAKRDGWPTVVVPCDNLAEASLVDGIEVWGVQSLDQLQALVHRPGAVGRAYRGRRCRRCPALPDLADVVGQTEARVRGRDRRRGSASPAADRAAGHREDHAGATASGPAPGADRGRGHRGHRHPFDRRHPGRPRPR